MSSASSPSAITLTPEEQDSISLLSQSYAVCNGAMIRLKADSPQQVATPKALNAVPVSHTLTPAVITKSAWEKANSISTILNTLVHKMSYDKEFILKHLKETAHGDAEFTGELYNLFIRVPVRQTIQFGLHRSDYMMHHDAKTNSMTPQQVELNTISSSFGCLSTIVQRLHQYLYERNDTIRNFYDSLGAQFVPSPSLYNMGKAFAAAHDAFNKQQKITADCILFIVQGYERNVFDQKHFEHLLQEKYKIPVVRMTLTQVANECSLEDSTFHLKITRTNKRVSVVYFRAAYTPNDYPSQAEWKARELLESSTAIKCPSLSYHLIGTKKIQQIMALPGVIEQYISKEDAALVRSCFTGLYSLDDNDHDNAIIKQAIEKHQDYVLKPQREGGGNLIHGEEMRQILMNITQLDREKYILMQRISPKSFKSYLLREGTVTEGDVICELGTFGAFIGDEKETILNENAGYLLRTKLANVEDGGVAAGVAFLDSVAIVQDK